MSPTCPTRAALVAVALLAAGCAKAPDPQAASLQNYVDRQAIETTLIRYSTGLDTFNAELYASAFTEDGVFAMEGKSYKGRAEIATVITDLLADRAKFTEALSCRYSHRTCHLGSSICQQRSALVENPEQGCPPRRGTGSPESFKRSTR